MSGATIRFRGFAGVELEAEVSGAADDPAILLLHGVGQTRAVWSELTGDLVDSGRRVISLDMRGHGGSEWPQDDRYDIEAMAEDLRAVLAQLDSRPVVVASTVAGWVATLALARDAAHLAAGLVLVDMPVKIDPALSQGIRARLRELTPEEERSWNPTVLDQLYSEDLPQRLLTGAQDLKVPTLVARAGQSWMRNVPETGEFDRALPNAELVTVDNSELLVVTNRTRRFLEILREFLERRQPRSSNEFRAGSDARTLRDSFGCFATGVPVVTASGEDGLPVGLTVNSFTSVSLDPPLLLVCIQNGSGSGEILRYGKHFAINVLQASQIDISNRFAGKSDQRFEQTAWSRGSFGAPLIAGALVSYECSRFGVHEAGDHFILVGEVERAEFEPRRDPLLYFRGRYRGLHFA